MIRIHRHDGGNIWMQMQKGTVEFIGFNDHPFTAAQYVIGFKIAGNSAQKRGTIYACTVQQMRSEGRGSGFAMRPSNGHSFHSSAQDTQYFCPFFDREAIGKKILVFSMTGRNGGCIHHQIHPCRDFTQVFFVMNLHAFSFQRVGQFC